MWIIVTISEMDLVLSVLDILILQNYFSCNNFKLDDLEKKIERRKIEAEKLGRKHKKICERFRLMIFLNEK